MAFIQTTRKKKIYRAVAAFLALNMLAEFVFPIAAHALTNGPSQPEVQSFEPVGTSDMVDLFTGDFNYNIPLFELPGPNGGYPFNLAYHSGIGMDQEASWVGLGWNLNPGAIVRDMRGLPDDFNGQTIKRRVDMKNHDVFGVGFGYNTEIVGVDGAKIPGPFSAMFSLYYNNYKGIGYSLSPSYRVQSDYGSNRNGIGFSLTLDSQEGVGVGATYAHSDSYRKNAREFNMGARFSSRSGLSISSDVGMGKISRKSTGTGAIKSGKGIGMFGTSTYAFAQQAYSPVTSTSTSGSGISFSFKFGAGAPFIFPNNNVRGFYHTQTLNWKNEEIDVAAYGYNHLGDAEFDYQNVGALEATPPSVYDVNREKDGILNKATPNLATPNLTYDIYNVQGQGTGGSFRAYRPEVGRMFDSPTFSADVSVSLGFEAGPPHLGTDIELSLTTTRTEPWDTDNEWSEYYRFRKVSQWDDNYADGAVAPEPVYYKSLGEKTSFDPSEMDYIGGEYAVRAVLERAGTIVSRKYVPQDEQLEKSNSEIVTGTYVEPTRNYRDRTSRNTTIEPLTNFDLLDQNGEEILPEYDISYYTALPASGYYPLASTTELDRSATRSGIDVRSHVAGITAFNPDGNRYVYGLPVYNLSHSEIAFTAPAEMMTGNLPPDDFSTPLTGSEPDYNINGTEEYYSETNLGPYVHSHLLTGILGTDYVDVTGNGITDDDYGYWVKFNYVKANGDGGSGTDLSGSSYGWRAPFEDAMYEPGLFSTGKDDKGYVEFGEKEVYYLGTVETKTHVAVFKISERQDGFESNGMFSSGGRGSDAYYKLDAIQIYAKDDYAILTDGNSSNDNSVRPIKTVHFDYTYELCELTQNSNATTTYGKLTLKQLWFEYQNNSRGSLSPYQFSYGTGSSNPDYSIEKYDRWSNYKSEGTARDRKYKPYVNQFDPSVLQEVSAINSFKALRDQDASAWNLNQIVLPTGGKINITYEADDYAYVQHRKATQMFTVNSFYDHTYPTKVYDEDDWATTDIRKRRIYFKLEKPIPTGGSAIQTFFDQYIAGLKQEDGTYQMYYKCLMQAKKDNETPVEFISGYSNLLVGYGGIDNVVSPDTSEYGFRNSTTSVDGVPCYTEGFVTLDLTHTDGANTNKYHPISVATWQHLRTTQPALLHSVGSITVANPSNMDKVAAAQSLLSVFGDIEQMMRGFRDYCFNQTYARSTPSLDYCVIRLCTPDQKKYGGGCRVKELSITDEWNAQSGETTSEYGQTYDYTTVNENGATISSGVAAYEPQIGGDEIALRHAKHYPQEIPIFTDNDLFFEYPVNESNYPAPVVGYSKVTVKSLTTADIISNTLSENVRGTGAVVTEFYTAKDFPVITDETAINSKPFDLYIPIPFIGQIQTNNFTASQGYSIVLNDMHGKLKKVTNYGLDAAGNILAKPESKVEYFYNQENVQMPDGIAALKLNNTVDVIYSDKNGTGGAELETDIQSAIVGEEYDFFTDQRKNRTFNTQAGLDFNVEIAGVIGFPFPWPSFSCRTNDVRTAVTNKIIHKSGILTKVVATDAQSEVTTEHKVFDAQTGRPLLVTVTNNFEDPIYRYDIPAHWEYDNMGAAYKNIDFSFIGKIGTINGTWDNFQIDATEDITWNTSTVTLSFDEVYDVLAEGDEFIFTYDNDGDNLFEVGETKSRATLIERREHCNSTTPVRTLLFHTPVTVVSGRKFMLQVVRSGRRNLLGVNAGSIVGLSDPTSNTLRGAENLANVSYNDASLAPHIAEFLNYVIDCNGQLVYKTYDLTSSIYYDSNGDHLFPTLSSVFSDIAIEQCDADEIRLVFTYMDPSGTCNQTTCGCYTLGHLPGETTIAPIASFTYSTGSTILINYVSGSVVGGASITLECLSITETPVVTHITDVLNASAIRFRDYWDYDATIGTCQSSSAAANLYAIGKKGIWRPWKDYYYSDERYRNTGHASGTQLATDGVFDGNGSDKKYYFFRWNANINTPVPEQWIENNTITRFDKDGNELENRNIIGNYSCAKFGYENTLAVAVAANARFFEVYYQSVEDDPGSVGLSGPLSGTNGPSTIMAHTGTYSLLVNDDEVNNVLSLDDHKFAESKEYVISMWVARSTPQYTYKESSSANSAGFTLSYFQMNGTTAIGSPTAIFEPTGEVIEGWQRIEAKFTTPANAASGEDFVTIEINFQGGSVASSNVDSFFDDIRIFPADGNMVSYVYDPVTFRLSAKLDDNNYATFYHYDEEGSLFLVKQETAKGIATIQEARSHKQHQ